MTPHFTFWRGGGCLQEKMCFGYATMALQLCMLPSASDRSCRHQASWNQECVTRCMTVLCHAAAVAGAMLGQHSGANKGKMLESLQKYLQVTQACLLIRLSTQGTLPQG
jgi:hypothetical protein